MESEDENPVTVEKLRDIRLQRLTEVPIQYQHSIRSPSISTSTHKDTKAGVSLSSINVSSKPCLLNSDR